MDIRAVFLVVLLLDTLLIGEADLATLKRYLKRNVSDAFTVKFPGEQLDGK